MSGILFLAHRLPFPPDRGDKIRSHHILKELAALAPVHVGCFTETAAEEDHVGEVARIAASHCAVRRTKPLFLAGAEALARGVPISLAAFRSRPLATWVRQTLARHPIDTVYVFSGQMGQYVPSGWRGRVIADLVDVDSAKFGAYADAARGPMRWVNRREERLLARHEAWLCARAERTLLVSEAEAQLLRSRVNDPGKIESLGNGIDTRRFDPAAVQPHPALLRALGPQLVFTGQMDYPPNHAAALRVIERLLPSIRSRFPNAMFNVVGRAPAASLKAHDGVDGVRVWGEVSDVRPYLADADLVLAPLEIARGVQNKVLEAMAMGRPVVLSAEAATGIDARDGEHFAVGDSDASLIELSVALLDNRDRAQAIGRAARRRVTERMGWAAMLARLPEIVGQNPGGQARDAA